MSADEDKQPVTLRKVVASAAHFAKSRNGSEASMATKRSPTSTDTIVGRRIRDYRLARHMPLSELSSRIGVSNPQMHRYECGLTRVAASRLIAIAAALEVSVEALTNMGDSATLMKPGNTADVDLLLRAFNSIDRPEQRHALIALARSMAGAGAQNQS